jgi:hypothetical protein
MHPSSLLSYYPTYSILDEIVSFGGYKRLNIFIDLKNTLQTTYMQHAIINIVESSKKTKFIDTAIFSSLIAFLTFHKIYAYKRGLDIAFVIFFESGHSYYHLNISKKYKISRKVDDLYGLKREDRELFYEVLQNNFRLIEKACSKLPSVRVVRLPNLEADFVPYYLLTRNLIERGDKIGNVIYSNDHDLWQCLDDDCFVFSKTMLAKKILKKGDAVSSFIKRDTTIDDSFYPLVMSVVGDVGDDVDGVRGVGGKRINDCFDQLACLTGSMNEVYDKVENNLPLFSSLPSSISNKHLNNIVTAETTSNLISMNLKLVSFELISRAVENPKTTEMLDKKNILTNAIQNHEVAPLESLKKALETNGVYLQESSIDILYI